MGNFPRFVNIILMVAVILIMSCGIEVNLVAIETPTPATITTHIPTTSPAPTGTSTPLPTSTVTPSPTTTSTPGPLGPFLPVSLGEDRPSGNLLDWRVAPDGTLWLATDRELASYTQGSWRKHPPYGDVLLGFDDAGRAWVSFEDGASIAAWDGDAWTVYGPQSGWTSAGPVRRMGPYSTFGEEIVTDERGWIWIVTQKDVRFLVHDRWTIFTPEGAGFTPSPEMIQEGFGYRLRDIALDRVGDVWVTDCAWIGPGPMGRGARWFTGNQWRGDKTEEVSSGCIEDIEVDSYGRIWIGIDGELIRYSPSEGWEDLGHPEFNPEWGMRWGWISDIALGADGTAWVNWSPCGGASCDTGLSILFALRDGEWVFVSDRGPFELTLDSEDGGWLCSGDGLFHISGEIIQPIYLENNLDCRVEVDAAGQLWLHIPGRSAFWMYDQSGPD